jgi:hypothetical protein
MAEQVHSALVYVYRERLGRADGSGYAQGAGMNEGILTFIFFVVWSIGLFNLGCYVGERDAKEEMQK